MAFRVMVIGSTGQVRIGVIRALTVQRLPHCVERLWVADDDGELVGFAWSWVCGELWFLAQLFVAPDRQSDGIGNQLISKMFAHAEKRGASVRALITFTFNNVSQGLYIRHGLFPRFPIYMVSVSRDRLASRLAEPRLHLEPLTAKTTDLDELALMAHEQGKGTLLELQRSLLAQSQPVH